MYMSLLLMLTAVVTPADLDRDYDLARGHLLVAMAQTDAKPAPDPVAPDRVAPNPRCRKCRGTGLVKSGDGLIDVPCDCTLKGSTSTEPLRLACDSTCRPGACTCGPECACANSTAAPPPAAPVMRAIGFTMLGCPQCPAFVAQFTAAKTTAPERFELIEYESARGADLFQQYNVPTTPTLLIFRDGVEVSRIAGAALTSLTAVGIADKVEAGLSSKLAVTMAPTPPKAPAVTEFTQYYWPSYGGYYTTPQPGYTYTRGADGRQYYTPTPAATTFVPPLVITPVVNEAGGLLRQMFKGKPARTPRVRCGPGGCYVR